MLNIIPSFKEKIIILNNDNPTDKINEKKKNTYQVYDYIIQSISVYSCIEENVLEINSLYEWLN